jgi:hypothetical protein
MTHPGKRLFVVGLVATLVVGVAYSAAYVVLVRKRLIVGSAATSGGMYSTSTTVITSIACGPTGSSGTGPVELLLEPSYTAILGWPDKNPANLALSYVFHPIHEFDRGVLRTLDWDPFSLFGSDTSPRFPWLPVKPVP